jgi:hypothetical protein
MEARVRRSYTWRNVARLSNFRAVIRVGFRVNYVGWAARMTRIVRRSLWMRLEALLTEVHNLLSRGLLLKHSVAYTKTASSIEQMLSISV